MFKILVVLVIIKLYVCINIYKKSVYLCCFYLHKKSLERIKSFERHGFSNASAGDFAFCVYLNFILRHGNNFVQMFENSKSIGEESFNLTKISLTGCLSFLNLRKSCLESLIVKIATINLWDDYKKC